MTDRGKGARERTRMRTGRAKSAAEKQPSNHRNVKNVKTGQDATRNAQVVRVIDKLQHGTARGEQGRERRASSPRGRTFEQHVVLIPKGAPVAVRAQPRRAGGAGMALTDKAQGLVTAQPKAKDAEDAGESEGQTKEGVVRRISRQGKPAVILDKAGPPGGAGPRTDIAGIPALPLLGDKQRQGSPDINGRHMVTVVMQGVPKSKQRVPNTPSPVPDVTTQSISPV